MITTRIVYGKVIADSKAQAVAKVWDDIGHTVQNIEMLRIDDRTNGVFPYVLHEIFEEKAN